jgi:hypothetical protein
MARFRLLLEETELAVYRQKYDRALIGEPIGIYSNPLAHQPETILVAERGLVVIRGGHLESIQFAQLSGGQGPHTKADDSNNVGSARKCPRVGKEFGMRSELKCPTWPAVRF